MRDPRLPTAETERLYRSMTEAQLHEAQRAFDLDGSTGGDRVFVRGRLKLIRTILQERERAEAAERDAMREMGDERDPEDVS
jgi:hypothetical protein